MQRLRTGLARHGLALLAFAVVTLIMTFPMVDYVFQHDIFWLPTGDERDIFIKIWDIWYGGLVLTGQADLFYTDRIFYPGGVSLASQPFVYPQIIFVNALLAFMPMSNALLLSYWGIILVNALSARACLLYIFKSQWPALFGAIVFGFSPQILSHYQHPGFMLLATLPLSIYFLHRGVDEKRWQYMVAAGILAGLTSVTNLYLFVCIVFTMGLGMAVLAARRWRDLGFWRLVIVLICATGLASAWRLLPLVSDAQLLGSALEFHGEGDRNHDLLSYLVNSANSFTAPLLESIFKLAPQARISLAAYIGYIPIALIAFGLLQANPRRKMLPWLGLWLIFFALSLGSTLLVNGASYAAAPMPKRYLNEVLPRFFRFFWENDHFILGMTFPMAVMATYGLKALLRRRSASTGRFIVMALAALALAEYYVPPADKIIPQGQFAFLDWLAEQNDADIRLINAPMGRHNAKRYNLYQALSGYTSAEGAISRTPDAAFDYIYASPILGEWREKRELICGFANSSAYLGEIDKLERDGFSHVVFHHQRRFAEAVAGSFTAAVPAYQDDYVNIFRLADLAAACPEYLFSARMPDAWAARTLLLPSGVHERHGPILGFQGDLPRDEAQLQLIAKATFDQNDVISIVDMAGTAGALSSNPLFRDLAAIPEVNDALWLVNNPQKTDLRQVDAYANWFSKIYRPCRRYLESEMGVIDLYVKHEFPCAAVEADADRDIVFDKGIRLKSFAYELDGGRIAFYLSWQKPPGDTSSFSLQAFDEAGAAVLHYDDVILRRALSAYRVEHDMAPGESYRLELIVYDYETGETFGGTDQNGEPFQRSLSIAAIEA